MDDHPHAHLVGHRADLAEEEHKVVSKFLGINPIVPLKLFPELVEGKTLLAARKPGDHRAGEPVDLLRIHLLKTSLRLGDVLF